MITNYNRTANDPVYTIDGQTLIPYDGTVDANYIPTKARSLDTPLGPMRIWATATDAHAFPVRYSCALLNNAGRGYTWL